MCLDNLCRYQCRYLCRNLNRYLWMTDTLLCCTAAGLLRRAEAETTNKDNITEVTRSEELTFGPEYLETVTCEPLVARKQPRCL